MFKEASGSYPASWRRGYYFYLLHVRRPKLFRILLLFSPQSVVLAGLLDADVTCTVRSGAVVAPENWDTCCVSVTPGEQDCCKKGLVFSVPAPQVFSLL